MRWRMGFMQMAWSTPGNCCAWTLCMHVGHMAYMILESCEERAIFGLR